MLPFADDEDEEENVATDEETSEDTADRPLRLAIVGRPNVGKSSLFNHILGDERSLTGPEPGLTRDSIAAPWTAADGRAILLHDTAGLRRSARAAGHTLEQLSIGSTLDAIRFADCVIVVIDATQPFEKQDLTIADLIEKEGRAVVFAVNKWDLVEDRAGAIGKLRRQLDESLPQLVGAPLIAISARSGEGVNRLLPAVLEADRAWNKHVATSALNRFLEEALGRHAPPAVKGRRVRIRYMTQPKVRPPTFALFGNQLTALPDAYSALSHQRVARGVRSRRHADPAEAARRYESVRGQLAPEHHQLAILLAGRRQQIDDQRCDGLRWRERLRVLARHGAGAHRGAQRAGTEQIDLDVRGSHIPRHR